MWNPIKAYTEHREARAAADDLQRRQEYAEQDARADREIDYIVAMERAGAPDEWEQVRNQFDDRQWVGQPVEPWTAGQIDAREAEIRESLDWADWGDEMRPNDADEASI